MDAPARCRSSSCTAPADHLKNGLDFLPNFVSIAHGFEPTREAAMAAFAKSWRRQ
jgi:hypothetical protein